MWYIVLGDSGILFTRYCYILVMVLEFYLLFGLYVCPCFHAYCDREYYYSFAKLSPVCKLVTCGVCTYNTILILVGVGGHLLLVA